MRLKRVRRKRFLFLVLGIGLSIWSFLLTVAPGDDLGASKSERFREDTFYDLDISNECLCVDSTDNVHHDFCYHLPEDRGIRGQKFPCSLLPLAKNVGVLDVKHFVRPNRGDFPEPVFITGASDSHFSEAKRAISTLQKFNPNVSIVFYDLGLNENNRREIGDFCQVVYRKFHFEAYPPHVRIITQYRWKPLIIAKTLKEFGAIWWMDSSVVWKKSNLSHVYELVKCRGRPHGSLPPPIISSEALIESGWDVAEWRRDVQRCRKFPYMLQGFTGHGIFPATHPHVYAYIPTNFTGLKSESAKMYEAGFLFAVRTPDVVKSVLKWYVLCALEKQCMGPSGAHLGCSFRGSSRYADYANCHRFDQSVVNLLLANRNSFDRHLYTSGIVDFFNIVRGSGSANPRRCPPLSPTP